MNFDPDITAMEEGNDSSSTSSVNHSPRTYSKSSSRQDKSNPPPPTFATSSGEPPTPENLPPPPDYRRNRPPNFPNPPMAMRIAYRRLTLHLTIPHPPPSFNDNTGDADEEAASERYNDAILLDWKSRILDLRTSDTLFLFSQGLTEARQAMETSIVKPFPNFICMLRWRENGLLLLY